MEKIRRHDLDWLRVIVFGLLIFYHVGMFFVPWGWHIKNNVIYNWLQFPMIFINQWRLPILFVISGMGTAYALSYRSGSFFILERLQRLLIPLLFGMLIIVPPQVYIERIYNGVLNVGYLDFFRELAFTTGVYPEGNLSWHHLWFLPYLLVYSIILTPIFIKIRNSKESRFLTWLNRSLNKYPATLFLFIPPLYLYESFLEPFFNVTHNLVWDWFNFISSLTLFLYGFILINVKESFWKAVQSLRYKAMGIGVLCFSLLLVRWLTIPDGTLVHFIEALIKVTNLWAWIITIFGFGSIYLNRNSKTLSYCNQAVYPFYILHQTITVIIGFYIYDKDWLLPTKFGIMVVGTFGFSWLIYEFLIRRIQFLWPLFGLKSKQPKTLNSLLPEVETIGT